MNIDKPALRAACIGLSALVISVLLKESDTIGGTASGSEMGVEFSNADQEVDYSQLLSSLNGGCNEVVDARSIIGGGKMELSNGVLLAQTFNGYEFRIPEGVRYQFDLNPSHYTDEMKSKIAQTLGKMFEECLKDEETF